MWPATNQMRAGIAAGPHSRSPLAYVRHATARSSFPRGAFEARSPCAAMASVCFAPCGALASFRGRSLASGSQAPRQSDPCLPSHKSRRASARPPASRPGVRADLSFVASLPQHGSLTGSASDDLPRGTDRNLCLAVSSARVPGRNRLPDAESTLRLWFLIVNFTGCLVLPTHAKACARSHRTTDFRNKRLQ